MAEEPAIFALIAVQCFQVRLAKKRSLQRKHCGHWGLPDVVSVYITNRKDPPSFTGETRELSIGPLSISQTVKVQESKADIGVFSWFVSNERNDVYIHSI